MNHLKISSVTFSLFTAFSLVFCPDHINAQSPDTMLVKEHAEVQIIEMQVRPAMARMEQINGLTIAAGKKNEVIHLAATGADLSTNNARQIFGRVPGLTIWESDGSGIQLSIATRGLSANRSWEFATRQDGYDISPDIFGYPESYYTPPMEALERVELLRGGASLQFGPQFGGLLNFVHKTGEGTQRIFYEGRQTSGSYGLLNSFNALGGQVGKVSYFAYLHNRSAEGWRENSRYHTLTGYASVKVQVSKNLSISAAYTRMNYSSQQPGGLTDEQFAADPRQSNRARNWFSAPWNVAALSADLKLTENARIALKTFAVMSERNSVGYVRAINVPDTLNVATGAYNARQLDMDSYSNIGAEVRYLQQYKLFNQKSSLALGARVYSCHTDRNQQGQGTTGSDADYTLVNPKWGRSLQFETNNVAVFAENIFNLTPSFSITPGVRYEHISNSKSGYINTTDAGLLKSETRDRNVLLAGIGMEWKLAGNTNLYANLSQAFRPITYSELTPSAVTEVIDPNLKDAKGYNADLGYRGSYSNWLRFDIGVFYLNYDNRVGTIVTDGVNVKTNIGTSVSKGTELYAEANVLRVFDANFKWGKLVVFASSSIIDARYTRWDNPALVSDPQKTLVGKRVEYAPRYTHRYGLKYEVKSFCLDIQMNEVGKVYADAANTEKASSNAQNGAIAGYHVADVSCGYNFNKQVNLLLGANNFFNESYATRRAGGYPGPGLLPGNGRTFYFTLGIKV